MSDPVCEVCGSRHHPRQAHSFAINDVANERLTDAINKPADHSCAINTQATGVAVDEVVGPEVGPARLGRSANRRSKEAYNAYMREYMRKRREARA